MSDDTHEIIIKWRQALKVGDIVVVQTDRAMSRAARCRTAVVERASPTQVVVDGEAYRRSDGQRRNAMPYHRQGITMPTRRTLEEVKRAFLLDSIENYSARFSKFETARLQAIYDAILLPLKAPS